MALIRPASYIRSISGKTSKAEDNVFYYKFNKTFMWVNQCYHGPYTTAQIAQQQAFATAATASATVLANSTQRASFESDFKSQSKYKTLFGYIMSVKLADSAGDEG